jgi:alpha-tubulin suppressor-like RCC1 family protein
VLAWGEDNAGQLGIGSHNGETRPVRVRFPGQAKMKIIAAGCLHSLAYSTSAQLYGWGINDWGQVGDGSTTEQDTPVTVSLAGAMKTSTLARSAPAPRVVSLFGGINHSLALLSNGVVLAWGDNSVGDLGNDKPGFSNVPVAVTFAAGLQVTGIGGGPCASTLFAIVHKT